MEQCNDAASSCALSQRTLLLWQLFDFESLVFKTHTSHVEIHANGIVVVVTWQQAARDSLRREFFKQVPAFVRSARRHCFPILKITVEERERILRGKVRHPCIVFRRLARNVRAP